MESLLQPVCPAVGLLFPEAAMVCVCVSGDGLNTHKQVCIDSILKYIFSYYLEKTALHITLFYLTACLGDLY